MHRSGTSAVSGVISRLGFDFGRSVEEPSWDNPKGYYENYKIQELNEEILYSLNRTWDQPGLIAEELIETVLEKFLKKAERIIQKEFKSSQIAIKDPRICLLFSFWKRVFESCNIVISTVFVLRSPDEIAASLKKRNFFNQEKSHLLTTSYLLSADISSRTLDRVVVSYDDLLVHPKESVCHLANDLSISKETVAEKMNAIESFIAPRLRNHKKIDPLDTDDFSSTHLSHRIYETLLRQAKDRHNPTYYTKLDDYRREFEKLDEGRLKKLMGDQTHFAKLILDYGDGLKESSSSARLIRSNNEQITYKLDDEKEVSRLVFFPANASCRILIHKIDFDFLDHESSYEISDNADLNAGDIYTFYEAFPQLIFKFEEAVRIRSFFIEVEYLSIDIKKSKQQVSAEIERKEDWQTAIFTLLKHPGQFLKNINLENYRTLKRALKRESLRQIIRNFIKLLKRPERQKEISQRSARNKKGLILSKNKVDLGEEALGIASISARPATIKAQVLYIAPSLPEYDTSSGGRRATEILRLIADNHTVTVLCLKKPEAAYKARFESYGIDVIDDPRRLKRERPLIDVIICAFYYTLHEVSDVLHIYPSARVIVDSVDVHWVRELRSISSEPNYTIEKVNRNKASEVSVYKSADVLWAVSKEDKAAIINEIPNAEVCIVSNVHSFVHSSYIDAGTKNILFIGGYTHHPNISAVRRLARDIFPIVKRRFQDAQLLIVGSNAPEEVIQLDDIEGVRFLGWVEEEDLQSLYEQTTASVAPLLSGAGVKGKISEAISHMTPVITNAIGNEGIGLVHRETGLLAETDEEFAEAIIDVLGRQVDLKSIALKAQTVIKKLVAPSDVLSNVKKSFYTPVSICIVTYNNLGLLKSCLKSIIEHTVHPNYNVIVYSNGCSDGTQTYLKELSLHNPLVHPIYSKTNDVFVRPNNHMMQLNQDRDVVLVNNDVEVTKEWLISLCLTAYRRNDIGIVGSKLLYPDGTLQEFGSELYEDGTGMNIGKNDKEPYRLDYMGTQAAGYVSGCSMYIKRSSIEQIGVFDDQFHPCYCEDSDFCYTAWDQGLATVVCPQSVVIHKEGSTSGVDTGSGFKRYQSINMKKFLLKHKDQLKKVRKKVKNFNRELAKRSIDIV